MKTMYKMAKPCKSEIIPDEDNPSLAFQTMSTTLLSKFAKGDADVDYYIRYELAMRGLNVEGDWVGFKNASIIHKI